LAILDFGAAKNYIYKRRTINQNDSNGPAVSGDVTGESAVVGTKVEGDQTNVQGDQNNVENQHIYRL